MLVHTQVCVSTPCAYPTPGSVFSELPTAIHFLATTIAIASLLYKASMKHPGECEKHRDPSATATAAQNRPSKKSLRAAQSAARVCIDMKITVIQMRGDKMWGQTRLLPKQHHRIGCRILKCHTLRRHAATKVHVPTSLKRLPQMQEYIAAR